MNCCRSTPWSGIVNSSLHCALSAIVIPIFVLSAGAARSWLGPTGRVGKEGFSDINQKLVSVGTTKSLVGHLRPIRVYSNEPSRTWDLRLKPALGSILLLRAEFLIEYYYLNTRRCCDGGPDRVRDARRA